MLHLGGLLREGAFYLLVDLNTFRKRCMQKFPSLASARHKEVLEYVFFLNTSQKMAMERTILIIEVFLIMTGTDCCSVAVKNLSY